MAQEVMINCDTPPKIFITADTPPKIRLEKICCCNVLLIAIYNSNCITDDDFSVSLNSNVLGTIDNHLNGKCTGRIFYSLIGTDAGPGPTRTNTDTGGGGPINCGCGGDDFEASISFLKALLINGTNTVEVASTDNNGAGNFGVVWVGCVLWDGSSFYLTKKILTSSTYGHGGGPPNKSTITFTYP